MWFTCNDGVDTAWLVCAGCWWCTPFYYNHVWLIISAILSCCFILCFFILTQMFLSWAQYFPFVCFFAAFFLLVINWKLSQQVYGGRSCDSQSNTRSHLTHQAFDWLVVDFPHWPSVLKLTSLSHEKDLASVRWKPGTKVPSLQGRDCVGLLSLSKSRNQ